MALGLLPSLLLALAQTPGAPAAGDFDHTHARWSALLRAHVHPPGGLVDYRGLARERGELEHYLATLEALTLEEFRGWTYDQSEAFWINAYNGYTVRLILDHYPIASIKDLGSFFRSVFDKELVPLQHLRPDHDPRERLTLGEVEHEILAEDFESPLFHFAIVCASTSCPELRAEAYVAGRLREQLEEQARHFLADPSKSGQHPVGGRLEVSRIFAWSEDELDRFPGGITALLRAFGPPAVAALPPGTRLRLSYRDYDWSLNEWKPNETEAESLPPR